MPMGIIAAMVYLVLSVTNMQLLAMKALQLTTVAALELAGVTPQDIVLASMAIHVVHQCLSKFMRQWKRISLITSREQAVGLEFLAMDGVRTKMGLKVSIEHSVMELNARASAKPTALAQVLLQEGRINSVCFTLMSIQQPQADQQVPSSLIMRVGAQSSLGGQQQNVGSMYLLWWCDSDFVTDQVMVAFVIFISCLIRFRINATVLVGRVTQSFCSVQKKKPFY